MPPRTHNRRATAKRTLHPDFVNPEDIFQGGREQRDEVNSSSASSSSEESSSSDEEGGEGDEASSPAPAPKGKRKAEGEPAPAPKGKKQGEKQQGKPAAKQGKQQQQQGKRNPKGGSASHGSGGGGAAGGGAAAGGGKGVPSAAELDAAAAVHLGPDATQMQLQIVLRLLPEGAVEKKKPIDQWGGGGITLCGAAVTVHQDTPSEVHRAPGLAASKGLRAVQSPSAASSPTVHRTARAACMRLVTTHSGACPPPRLPQRAELAGRAARPRGRDPRRQQDARAGQVRSRRLGPAGLRAVTTGDAVEPGRRAAHQALVCQGAQWAMSKGRGWSTPKFAPCWGSVSRLRRQLIFAKV